METTRRQWLAAGVALAVLSPGRRAGALAATSSSFHLIVNPSNTMATAERKFLADAFLKKITRWPGTGEVIRPVDLRADAPVRHLFTDEVLHRSVAAVKNYWQQLVFSGRELPPPEVDNDEQVIRYVTRSAGAVGYVSGGANLERVKVLTLR